MIPFTFATKYTTLPVVKSLTNESSLNAIKHTNRWLVVIRKPEVLNIKIWRITHPIPPISRDHSDFVPWECRRSEEEDQRKLTKSNGTNQSNVLTLHQKRKRKILRVVMTTRGKKKKKKLPVESSRYVVNNHFFNLQVLQKVTSQSVITLWSTVRLLTTPSFKVRNITLIDWYRKVLNP